MTAEDKLKEVEDFVNKVHKKVSDLLEEADEMEENGHDFEEHERSDIHGWDAISCITSQLLDILKK